MRASEGNSIYPVMGDRRIPTVNGHGLCFAKSFTSLLITIVLKDVILKVKDLLPAKALIMAVLQLRKRCPADWIAVMATGIP